MLFLWEFNFVNSDHFVLLFCKNKLLGLVRTGCSPSDCKTAYFLFEDFTVWPGKPWTLEISQECLLCYDQSQQIKDQDMYELATKPQNN